MKVYTLMRYDRPSSNTYIVLFDDEAIVIDPSVSYNDAIKEYPELAGFFIKYILLTHAHADHMWEIESYKTSSNTVFVAKDDEKFLKDFTLNCSKMLGGYMLGYFGEYSLLNDNDILKIKDENIKVIATPGHTPGAVSFLINNVLFSGDTLFSSGGYGRFDLPGGNPVLLSNSLNKLFSLENSIRLYPGHGEASTIGETKKYF